MTETAAVANALSIVNGVLFANSAETSQEGYAEWSKHYDKHMEILGSAYAVETGKMFEKYGKNCKDLLDVGTGTGHVVEHARNAGYNGVADILDANMEMLMKAAKKNIDVRNVIRHFITEDGNLPIKNDMYDIVTSAGTFIPNHAPATALRGIFDVIKKGGLFIVTTRSKSTETYKVDFDAVVEELKNAGKIEVVEIKEFKHFQKSNQDTTSMVYVLKKL